MSEVAPQVPHSADDISAIDRATSIWGDAQLIKTLSCDRFGWTGRPTGSLVLIESSTPPQSDNISEDYRCSRLEKAVSIGSFSALGGLFFAQSVDSLGDIPQSVALNPLVIGLAGSLAVIYLVKGRDQS